jgi:hypothetical protein
MAKIIRREWTSGTSGRDKQGALCGAVHLPASLICCGMSPVVS